MGCTQATPALRKSSELRSSQNKEPSSSVQASQKELNDQFHTVPSPLGVSLSHIKSLIANCQAQTLVHDVFEDHDQLCARLSEDSMSVKLLKATADVYISFPPDCTAARFLQTLNDLRDDSAFVWIDAHSSKTNGQERSKEYLENLFKVLKSVRKVIIICSPSPNPTKVSAFRSLELFFAVSSGATVRAVASKKECDEFIRGMREGTIGVSGFSNALRHELEMQLPSDAPISDMIRSNLPQIKSAVTAVFNSLIARLCDESLQGVGDDDEVKAHALVSFASFLYVSKEYEESKKKFEEALQVLTKLRDNSLEISVLHNIAKIHEDMGHLTQAAELYDRCLTLEKPMFKLSNKLSSTEVKASDISPRSSGDQAHQGPWRDSFVVPQFKDNETARTALNRACIFARRGDYEKADELFQEAFELFKRSADGNSLDVAWCANTIGVYYEETGKATEALEMYELALKLRSKLDAPVSHLAETYTNLGCYLLGQGEYDQSKSHLEKAFTIHLQSNGRNSTGVANALLNLARWWEHKDKDKSKELSDEAIDIMKSLPNPDSSEIQAIEREFSN